MKNVSNGQKEIYQQNLKKLNQVNIIFYIKFIILFKILYKILIVINKLLILLFYNFNYLYVVEDNSTEVGGGEDEKKRQKRGGKGMLKTKKKEDVPKLVTVSRAPRGKKKSVTVVTGLSTFGNIKCLFKLYIQNNSSCKIKILFTLIYRYRFKSSCKIFWQ